MWPLLYLVTLATPGLAVYQAYNIHDMTFAMEDHTFLVQTGYN